MATYSGPQSALDNISSWPSDLSGNGNHLVNVTGTTDFVRTGSVPLYGTSYGKILNHASFSSLSAFTLIANIRRNRQTTVGELICLPAGPTWVTPYARLRMHVGNNNLGASIQSDSFSITSANTFVAGPWWQAGLCWDGTAKVARLVINGVQAGTVTTTGISQLTSTTQDLYIGDIGVTPYQFEGEFGEIAMFNVNKGVSWFTDVWTEQNPEGAGQKRPLPDESDGSGWIDMTGRIIHLRGGGDRRNPR